MCKHRTWNITRQDHWRGRDVTIKRDWKESEPILYRRDSASAALNSANVPPDQILFRTCLIIWLLVFLALLDLIIVMWLCSQISSNNLVSSLLITVRIGSDLLVRTKQWKVAASCSDITHFLMGTPLISYISVCFQVLGSTPACFKSSLEPLESLAGWRLINVLKRCHLSQCRLKTTSLKITLATASVPHLNLWPNCQRLSCIVGNVGARVWQGYYSTHRRMSHESWSWVW